MLLPSYYQIRPCGQRPDDNLGFSGANLVVVSVRMVPDL